MIAWFLVTSGQRKEEFAARSLNQARAAAEAGNLPLASSELQKLIQTYKGTDAATEAVITLNQVRMVNGQSELAAVGLRDFLATKPRARVRRTGLRAAGCRPRELPASSTRRATAFMSASKAADAELSQGPLPAGRGAGLPRGRQDAGGDRGLPGGHPEVSQDLEHDRGAGPAGGADRRQDVTARAREAGQTAGSLGGGSADFVSDDRGVANGAGAQAARYFSAHPGHRRSKPHTARAGGALNPGDGTDASDAESWRPRSSRVPPSAHTAGGGADRLRRRDHVHQLHAARWASRPRSSRPARATSCGWTDSAVIPAP